MLNIEKIGFEILTEKTQNDFQKLFDEYSKKIEHKLKNADSLKIRIKEHSPGGKIKFSIQVTANYSGKILEASVSDWDLNRAFHKVFNKIEQETEHIFHISDQNKKNKSRK
jgi:ribosome-associated translation inhibitor RaiA